VKSLLVLLALTSATSTVLAKPAAPSSKKDREWAAKSDKSEKPLPKVGVKPAKLVNVFNTWTDEWLAVDPASLPSQEMVNQFLRDHYTDEPTQMEPKLIPIVTSAATNFGATTVFVVSAYRHPKYNLLLRKKGHQVARDSNHTHGNAIDFYLNNVGVKALHKWAVDQKLGGVGLYTGSGFVHMDTGRIRYWNGD
jgi:uncharacterized protein YcbK (DUF882 family)